MNNSDTVHVEDLYVFLFAPAAYPYTEKGKRDTRHQMQHVSQRVSNDFSAILQAQPSTHLKKKINFLLCFVQQYKKEGVFVLVLQCRPGIKCEFEASPYSVITHNFDVYSFSTISDAVGKKPCKAAEKVYGLFCVKSGKTHLKF